LADEFATSDAKAFFVRRFGATWAKVMDTERFDAA
jgi:catalase-peroxidase